MSRLLFTAYNIIASFWHTLYTHTLALICITIARRANRKIHDLLLLLLLFFFLLHNHVFQRIAYMHFNFL